MVTSLRLSLLLSALLCIGAFSGVAKAQVGGGASGPKAASPRGVTSGPTTMGLGQNYPNPFSPATRIPFTVGNPPVCTDRTKEYHVSLKIYNLLAQLVAVPKLIPNEGAVNADSAKKAVQELSLSCGQYTAYWNGSYLSTSQAVAPGMYLYRLEVNGKATVKKMFVLR